MRQHIVFSLICMLCLTLSFAGAGYASKDFDNLQRYHLLQLAKDIQQHKNAQSPNMTKPFLQMKNAESGAISGRVLGIDDEFAQKAFVEAFGTETGQDSLYERMIAPILPDGDYRIDGLPEGSYYVLAWAESYEVQYFKGANDLSEATAVDVVANETTEGIDFYLEKIKPGSSAITGHVMQDDGLTPIPRAGVQVLPARGFGSWGWTETDAQGAYLISDLKEGDYTVMAWAEGFLPEYYQEADSLHKADIITLAENDTLNNIDFTLSHGATISGTVTDSSGKPIQSVYVEVLATFVDSVIFDNGKPGSGFSFVPVAKGVTDELGRYSISGLPTGTFYVRALYWSRWYYIERWYDNATSLEEATAIDLKAGERLENIDFTMDIREPNGVIAGYVVDLNGNAIVGAYVQVQSHQNHWEQEAVWASATTGADGSYRIGNLPQGEYLVSAWAGIGWQYAFRWWPDAENMEDAQPVLLQNNGLVEDINFKLPIEVSTASISGVVKTLEGDPVQWASIQLSPAPSANDSAGFKSVWAYGTTDSTGYYLISQLPEGDYIAYASAWQDDKFGQQWYNHADSYETADVISLAEGEAKTGIDFSLNLKPIYGSLTGVVVDKETQAPIPRAYVEIQTTTVNMRFAPWIGWPSYAITGENGAFSLDWMWEGEYLVAAYVDGGFTYYEEGIVPDQATPVKIVGGDKTELKISVAIRKDGEGSINGRVLSEENYTPLDIAVVKARPAMTITLWPDSEKFYTAITDKNGNYSVKGLPDADYIMYAFAPYTIGKYFDNVYDPSEAKLVRVENGSVVEGIDFSLPQVWYRGMDDANESGLQQNAAQIYGTVTDTAGDSLSGVTVLVFLPQGQAIASAQTQTSGRYELGGLPPGEYLLKASKIGYLSQYNGNVENLEDAEFLNLTVGATEVNFVLPGRRQTNVEQDKTASMPRSVALIGNYPNPFNPSTNIMFELPQQTRVSVDIYNISGALVRRVLENSLPAGRHTVSWDGQDQYGAQVSSGVYLVQLKAGDNLLVRKILLMR
jgi:hypothetical protein